MNMVIRKHTLSVYCVAVAMAACQPRQNLNEFVTQPVLAREPIEPVYLADTRLQLSIPRQLAVEEKTAGDAIIYSFTRNGELLFSLHLTKIPSDARAHTQPKGGKTISVGFWKGSFFEAPERNTKFAAELLIDLRKNWLRRFSNLFENLTWKLARRLDRPADYKVEKKRFEELVIRELPFNVLHFRYSNLSKTDRNLALEIASTLTVEPINALIWTSTVDWFKPPPDDSPNGQVIAIPFGLMLGVSPPLHDEAAALLGSADCVALTNEQAQHFWPGSNPDSVLQSLIKENMEKLRFSRDHPLDPKTFSKRDWKQVQASEQRSIDSLNSKIEQHRQLEHRLKPYLIKAVTLQDIEGFSGVFLSEDLVVTQTSLGRHPVPMKRMPVVAYLPMKPHKVYTDVSMAE